MIISLSSFFKGRVQFENNERLGLVEILQWRNGSYIEIGYFDGSNELFTLYQIIKTGVFYANFPILKYFLSTNDYFLISKNNPYFRIV